MKYCLKFGLTSISLAILAACGQLAPAVVPAQLSQTPGPPITVSNGVYHSTGFEVKMPVGWQIISSPAYSQPWVVFLSPEEDAVIVVAQDETDTNVVPPIVDGGLETILSQVELRNSTVIFAALATSQERASFYTPLYQLLQESITTPGFAD